MGSRGGVAQWQTREGRQIYYNLLEMSFSILFPTNQFKDQCKSPEQIQLLTLPPCLSMPESLSYIATKGHSPQYPYLYRHLAQAHSRVLSFVCAQAPSETPDNQVIIASSFRELLQSGLLSSEEQVQIFEACLECLNNLQSVANDELATVIELILKVHSNKPQLLRRLETVALELGKPAQPSISKVTAGRLVTIVGAESSRTVKNELVDILKRVLSDSEVEARKIGLSELFPKLLQVFELQFVELHFQERLFEAVWDEDEQVGVLALEVILKNAACFSPLEQGSRIVRLFVDSLTSKNEKMAVAATSLMGEAYQKLQLVILRSESHCLGFWKSLVELSQCGNQKVLNNMAFNLPGILALAAPYHRVDPLCDIYIDLFYNPRSDKLLLASYFHEMVRLFPSKWADLRELFFWMISQLLEDGQLPTEALRIMNKIIARLSQIRCIFVPKPASAEGKFLRRQEGCFDAIFCGYLTRYLDLLVRRKVSAPLLTLLASIRSVCSFFTSEFIESTLLPKLYACLRGKITGLELATETIVVLLSQEGNPQLTNTYVSRVSTELMRSSRSYERDIALSFFYHCTFQFSVEVVQEYRLGEKCLSFNTDQNYKIRSSFISRLPRLWHFLSKEERIEYSIILSRLRKDPDGDVQSMVSSADFSQKDSLKLEVSENSGRCREYEKERLAVLNIRKQRESVSRRPNTIRQLRKDDVVRKRMDSTRGKAKAVLKEAPNKRKMAPLMLKANSNHNLAKHS